MNRTIFRNLLFSFLCLYVFASNVQAQLPQLRSYDCNRVNTQLYQNLYANITGGSQYKFKVTNTELGVTDSIVNPHRYFNLNQMPSIARYNCNYEVVVCMDNGSGFGPYGSVCNPSSAPKYSRLRQVDCGRNLPSWNYTVYASVTTADSWDFQIRTPNSLVTEIIANQPTRAFNLSLASSYYQNPGQEYEVRVRTTQGGILQPWGAWCSIYTPSITAVLRSVDCGRSLPWIPYNVYANITTADSWDFQVRDASDTNFVENVFDRPNRTFNLNYTVSNLFKLYNREYQVRVRTSQGGVLQPWGDWCSIYTPFPLLTGNMRDMTVFSSAGGFLINNSSFSGLIIANNVGEAVTQTFYGNPYTFQDSSMVLNQGFEQPSKWIVQNSNPNNPIDMPVQSEDKNQELINDAITLFPNPYTNELNVSKLENKTPYTLRVYDFKGSLYQTVLIQKMNETLHLEDLAPGKYYFEFTNSVNSETTIKTVIKSY